MTEQEIVCNLDHALDLLKNQTVEGGGDAAWAFRTGLSILVELRAKLVASEPQPGNDWDKDRRPEGRDLPDGIKGQAAYDWHARAVKAWEARIGAKAAQPPPEPERWFGLDEVPDGVATYYNPRSGYHERVQPPPVVHVAPPVVFAGPLDEPPVEPMMTVVRQPDGRTGIYCPKSGKTWYPLEPLEG